MESYFKKPKWKYGCNKSYRFVIFPRFTKSYSLSEPQWKTKWGTPRCERVPYVYLDWFGFIIDMHQGTDDYWEKWLWIHKFNHSDEELARSGLDESEAAFHGRTSRRRA